MIDLNLNPERKELRVFAVGWILFFSVAAFMVYRRTDSTAWLAGLGALAAVVGGAGVLVPSAIKPIYQVWMIAVFPIGWVISHIVVGIVFYLVMTPIGLIMRLSGRDPLSRAFEPDAKTYWVEHKPPENTNRYFRQF